MDSLVYVLFGGALVLVSGLVGWVSYHAGARRDPEDPASEPADDAPTPPAPTPYPRPNPTDHLTPEDAREDVPEPPDDFADLRDELDWLDQRADALDSE